MELTDIEAIEYSIEKVLTEITRVKKVLNDNNICFDEGLISELNGSVSTICLNLPPGFLQAFKAYDEFCAGNYRGAEDIEALKRFVNNADNLFNDISTYLISKGVI